MSTDRKESPKSAVIKVYGRSRFLRLEEPKSFEAGGKPRWEATSILDPSDVQQAKDIKLALETAALLSKEHYGKVPLAIKKLAAKFIPGTPKLDLNDPKNEPDNIRVFCVADGDAEKYKNYAGYPGNFIIAASNTKLRPDVATRKGVKASPGEPQYPYDGAYTYTSISFWLLMGAQAQKTGPLVGCNLRGVQFVKDGQRFTQDEINDEFQALEDEATTSDLNAFD